MNNKLLLLIKKPKNKLFKQTMTKPQETLEFQLKKPREVFSFSLPINPFQESNGLIAVTNYETSKSVLILTGENISFSTTTPSHWTSEDSKEIFNKLKEMLELRSQNGIDLHVKEVEKRRNGKEIENGSYNVEGFDQFKSETIAELGGRKYRDLVGMVCRMALTYDENSKILDIKN